MDAIKLPPPTIITLIKNEINKLKNNLEDFKNIRERKFSTNNVVELFNEEDVFQGIDKSSVDYLLYEELKFIQTEIAKEVACYKKIFAENFKIIKENDSTDSHNNSIPVSLLSLDEPGNEMNTFLFNICVNDMQTKMVVPDNNIKKAVKVGRKRKIDNNTGWKCDVCGKTFENKSYLTVHQRFHTSERPYQCEICGKSYRFKHEAKTHALIHSGLRPHKCQYCPKDFMTRKQCGLHERIHTGDRRYSCETCNKSFITMSALNTHRRKHNGTSTPHQCNICYKSFSSAPYLVGHKRLHTGEKPFNCKVCGKAFNLEAHSKRHERWHAMCGKKLFDCDLCDKSFDTRSGLKSHKTFHANVRKFKCGICNKGFVTKSHVQRHLKTHKTDDLDNYLEENLH